MRARLRAHERAGGFKARCLPKDHLAPSQHASDKNVGSSALLLIAAKRSRYSPAIDGYYAGAMISILFRSSLARTGRKHA
jgi:hypothetical protein